VTYVEAVPTFQLIFHSSSWSVRIPSDSHSVQLAVKPIMGLMTRC